jgi:hypothetical protein
LTPFSTHYAAIRVSKPSLTKLFRAARGNAREPENFFAELKYRSSGAAGFFFAGAFMAVARKRGSGGTGRRVPGMRNPIGTFVPILVQAPYFQVFPSARGRDESKLRSTD